MVIIEHYISIHLEQTIVSKPKGTFPRIIWYDNFNIAILFLPSHLLFK